MVGDRDRKLWMLRKPWRRPVGLLERGDAEPLRLVQLVITNRKGALTRLDATGCADQHAAALRTADTSGAYQIPVGT
jgi:hypothetical protein